MHRATYEQPLWRILANQRRLLRETRAVQAKVRADTEALIAASVSSVDDSRALLRHVDQQFQRRVSPPQFIRAKIDES